MEPKRQILADIAQKHLSVNTLDARKSDRLDFHGLAVWNIDQALNAAFEAGLQAAEEERRTRNEDRLSVAHVGKASKLTDPGRWIFMEVLAAMQDAEEMGGPTQAAYIALMTTIIREASERIAYYAAWAWPEES